MKISKLPAEMKFAVRSLARELRRLDPEQGRLARKNAREEVLLQLRRLRTQLDEAFPPIAKAAPESTVPRPRTAPRTPAQVYGAWKAKQVRKNYGPVNDTSLALCIAKAGVRLVDPPKRTGSRVQYAPMWAIVGACMKSGLDYNEAKVRELKKSVTARKATLAAQRLGGLP